VIAHVTEPPAFLRENQSMKSKSNTVPRNWGGSCQTWELLSRSDFAVFHERMPPGTSEVEHFHSEARQFFFVLEGELNITVLGRDYVLRAHEGLEVSPGERHVVRNISGGATEFLAIAHPTTLGDRTVSST